MQGQINDDSKNNCAEYANQRALGVCCNQSQLTGREGNDGNNNACLGDRLSLDLKDNFIGNGPNGREKEEKA
jgi:hypothetical protein